MWRPKEKGKPPISTLKPRESFSSYCSILLFSTVSSRIRLNCSKLVNGVSCSTVGSGNLVRSIKTSIKYPPFKLQFQQVAQTSE
uniref:Putative ovule protein n=1 Tax=Solanum chacoense TaxID=4108 RepID=A0A0V0HL35_SOLCH